MCLGGEETEIETFRRLLKTYPTGILSVVSDTWDFWKVLTEYLPLLKDEIMARDGKLVIRPDSGDPADIICGLNTNFDYTYEVDRGQRERASEAEEKGAIQILAEIFGTTENAAGYEELDSHIGLIYGDGMFKARIENINARLEYKGFVSTVWVAGLGSWFFQYNTRDTFSSAVKATYGIVNGVGRDVQKNPKTDDGTKKSAKGRLAVGYKANGELYQIQGATDEEIARSVIQPVWENGKFLKKYAYKEVRGNVKRTTEILERNGSIS
jgi:nicotinamide phosphoribosyltransferase